MPDFSKRSYQKELLDQENIPQKDLFRNLRELEIINTWLGGHKVTLYGLSKLLKDKNKTYHIVDIGSGGGDTLKNIAEWGRKKQWKLQLTGVDLKDDCITYAQNHCKDYPEISFIQSDYRDVHHLKADIFTSALFCHHLGDEDLKGFVQWMQQNAQIGFVINDLHRHPLAYYSIKWLTKLFSKSYLVKNDAALSVLRSFDKTYWLNTFQNAQVSNFVLEWIWAFRWCIIGKSV